MIIPRPFESAVVDGTVAIPSEGGIVLVTDPDLDSVVSWFVADLAAFGVTLRAARRVDAAAPAVVVVDLDTGLDDHGAAATCGVSPAGRDPSDERYRIRIDTAGVRITGAAPEGVFRGLTSLFHLITTVSPQAGVRHLPGVDISDRPRFAWRGLSLDVARTFYAPAEVREVIDMCALYKLNALHLHLSDDQGWRIEIDGRPELTSVGAAGAVGDRPGGFYSQAEFVDLVAYAHDRFVTIIPELDMPGHSAAVLASYPGLAAPSSVSPAPPGPANVLDPTVDGVLPFVREVIDQVASVTSGPYIHIGGDEAFGMPADHYRSFIEAVRAMVAAAGKRVVGWQEIARADVDHTDVAQFWFAPPPELAGLLVDDGSEPVMPEGLSIPVEFLPAVRAMFADAAHDLDRMASKGTGILLSPSSHVYLDTPYAEAPADPAQATRQQGLGLQIYPRQTVRDFFEWEPSRLSGVRQEAVVGIEGAVWCETLGSFDDLVFMLLPRLPGIAEKAWSPPDDAEWVEYRARLARQSGVWTVRNWDYFTSSEVDWI